MPLIRHAENLLNRASQDLGFRGPGASGVTIDSNGGVTLTPATGQKVTVAGDLDVTGTMTGTVNVDQLQLEDDEQLQFGTGPDYHYVYDPTAGEHKLVSRDIDGGGTNGTIWSVADGQQVLDFAATPTIGGADVFARLDQNESVGGQWTINALLTLADGVNLAVGSTNGAQIATAATQLLGFFGATPVVQPAAYTQTFSTADKTHAARTAAALTDNSGGTASDTIPGVSGTGDDANLNDIIASLVDEINKLRDDQRDTASVLNAVVDDLQDLGLAA